MNTVTQVIEKIRELASERPYFNYKQQPMENPWLRGNTCSYVSASRNIEEGEGCIVGQALSRLGFTDDQLTSVEGVRAASALVRLDLAEYIGDDDSHWINGVQGQQDEGNDWGDCVAYADKHYPLDTNL